MPGSLTGDPSLDAHLPVATRLACGLREFDPDEVAAALAAATSSPDTAQAVLVILAAMVPYEETPADLLAWVHRRDEYDRLVNAGLDTSTAATLIARPATPRG